PGRHHQSGRRTPGLVPDPPRAPRRALGTQTRAGGTGPDSGPGRQEDPDPGLQGSPDLLLVSAVRVGVLSQTQAQLIAQTRLEDIPLTQIAEQSGVSYKALAKRRERAETRLRRAVSAGEVVIADALLRSEGLHDHERAALRRVSAAPTRGMPLSHRPRPQASEGSRYGSRLPGRAPRAGGWVGGRERGGGRVAAADSGREKRVL